MGVRHQVLIPNLCHVACCLLPAACCLLPVACCLLPVACCLLPAAAPICESCNSYTKLCKN